MNKRILTEKAIELALSLWAEQYRLGIAGEAPDVRHLDEWLINRAYDLNTLEAAASGDVEALLEVRLEAGLPPLV